MKPPGDDVGGSRKHCSEGDETATDSANFLVREADSVDAGSEMSESPIPYVAAEVLDGRLVRLCPECKTTIRERTDADGMVSNNFAEHWEAEHREQPPERERLYLISLQPRDDGEPGLGPEAARNMSQHILEIVRRQMPTADWEFVPRIEDLPEGAPALIAWQALRGSWQSEGDDPQLRQVRWHRRDGDRLVFTPTESQLKEWDTASRHARDVRAALIERHRDELPKFEGKSAADWEPYSEALSARENEIASEFDEQQRLAREQFYCGDYRWEATLEAAIDELGIPESEVEELRLRTEARMKEVEELLSRK